MSGERKCKYTTLFLTQFGVLMMLGTLCLSVLFSVALPFLQFSFGVGKTTFCYRKYNVNNKTKRTLKDSSYFQRNILFLPTQFCSHGNHKSRALHTHSSHVLFTHTFTPCVIYAHIHPPPPPPHTHTHTHTGYQYCI